MERGEFQAGWAWFDEDLFGELPPDLAARAAQQEPGPAPAPAPLAPPELAASSQQQPAPLLSVPTPAELPLLSLPSIGAQPEGSGLADMQEQEQPQAQLLAWLAIGEAPPLAQPAATAAAREEKRRAVNRASQARYRERQKAQKEAVAAELAAKEAELQRRRSEHGQLAERNAVLEKLLAAKDAQIAAARLGSLALQDGDVQQQRRQGGEQGAGASTTQPAQPSAAGEKAAALAALPGPGDVLQGQQPLALQAAGQGSSAGEEVELVVRHPPGWGHSLAALLQEQPELRERALSMSPEDFLAHWRATVTAYAEVLGPDGSQAEPHSGTEEHTNEQIQRIFEPWSTFLRVMVHVKPSNAQALFATAEGAPPGTWEKVAARLQPTHAQRTRLRQLWHTYAARVAAIRAERAAAMQSAQHAGAAAPASVPTSTLGELMAQYLALFDAAGHMSSLQDAELMARLQLMVGTSMVFSAVDKAHVGIAAYPRFPDVVQVVRAIAEQAEQIDQREPELADEPAA
ncbi:hypothetical protein ABPG75_011242 [Micractinium tetrahymenae]